MKLDQVAVQMYTLREHASADLDATFWKLAEIGYKQVEFAGYYGNTVDDVAAMMERHGLRAPASHIQFADFESRFDGVIEDAKTLGFEWLIVPAGPIRDATPEEALAKIERLDTIASKVADAGFKFAYHNHAFEFELVFDDGSTWYDRLLAGTNPDTFKLEVDAFWVNRGGKDSTELIRTNAERVRLVHIKDAANDDPGRDVPFGEGSLDWKSILEASEAAGVEYYVTEQDHPGDAFEDVEIALRNAEKWSS